MCKNSVIKAGMYIKPVKDMPWCLCGDKEYLVSSDADGIYIQCDVGRHYLHSWDSVEMTYFEKVDAR